VTDQTGDRECAPIVELAAPGPADAALDYGCGVGEVSFALAPLVGSLECADDDAEVLREAERLAAELRLDALSFRHVDLLALPYPAGRFSLVVARGALQRLVDVGAGLAEMARVLAPGGRLVLDEVLVDEITDRHLNELARLRESTHWRHYRQEEYEELFAAAGLRTTAERRVRRGVDLDYWIEAAQTPARNAEIIRRRAQTLPVDVQTALDVAYADRRVSLSFDVLVARLER
jgi:SAM-dependent methyltransferase